MNIDIYIYTYIYIDVHIHLDTHTYTHSHIFVLLCVCRCSIVHAPCFGVGGNCCLLETACERGREGRARACTRARDTSRGLKRRQSGFGRGPAQAAESSGSVGGAAQSGSAASGGGDKEVCAPGRGRS